MLYLLYSIANRQPEWSLPGRCQNGLKMHCSVLCRYSNEGCSTPS